MLFILLAVVGAFAQNNNMVVFSEGGERFTLILNGIRQNATPETNVKVTGLNAPNYKVKIIFESKALFDLDQNIYLQWGGESTSSNTEYTYSIVNKKGKYKIRPVSAAPINTGAPAAPNQTVVVYTTTDAVAPVSTNTTTTTTTTGTETTGATVTTNVGGTTNESVTTTTTTTGTTTPTGENISLGVNMNGMGVNMNVNINDGTGVAGTQTTTTTTSTTYSSTVTTTGTGTTTTATPAPVATTTSTSGCVYGMSSSDFSSAKSSIQSKSFEDSKMTMAKQVIKNNCLTTAQVKEIMEIFSFEETKLDLAKYAYDRTVDPNNYYKLNDAFTFESSIEELDKYIESQKK